MIITLVSCKILMRVYYEYLLKGDVHIPNRIDVEKRPGVVEGAIVFILSPFPAEKNDAIFNQDDQSTLRMSNKRCGEYGDKASWRTHLSLDRRPREHRLILSSWAGVISQVFSHSHWVHLVQNCTPKPVSGVENLSLRLGFLVITSFYVRVLSLRKIENPEKRWRIDL